jgi:hypothetical protein
LNINTQELQPSLIIKKKKTKKIKQTNKNKKQKTKRNKKPMKYTSATQFDICQMTNRQDLYNN